MVPASQYIGLQQGRMGGLAAVKVQYVKVRVIMTEYHIL